MNEIDPILVKSYLQSIHSTLNVFIKMERTPFVRGSSDDWERVDDTFDHLLDTLGEPIKFKTDLDRLGSVMGDMTQSIAGISDSVGNIKEILSFPWDVRAPILTKGLALSRINPEIRHSPLDRRLQEFERLKKDVSGSRGSHLDSGWWTIMTATMEEAFRKGDEFSQELNALRSSDAGDRNLRQINKLLQGMDSINRDLNKYKKELTRKQRAEQEFLDDGARSFFRLLSRSNRQFKDLVQNLLGGRALEVKRNIQEIQETVKDLSAATSVYKSGKKPDFSQRDLTQTPKIPFLDTILRSVETFSTIALVTAPVLGPVGFLVGAFGAAIITFVEKYIERLDTEIKQRRDILSSGGLIQLAGLDATIDETKEILRNTQMSLSQTNGLLMSLEERYEIYKAGAQFGISYREMIEQWGSQDKWSYQVGRLSLNMGMDLRKSATVMGTLMREFQVRGDGLKKQLFMWEQQVQLTGMLPSQFVETVINGADTYITYGNRLEEVGDLLSKMAATGLVSGRQLQEHMGVVFHRPDQVDIHQGARYMHALSMPDIDRVINNAIRTLMQSEQTHGTKLSIQKLNQSLAEFKRSGGTDYDPIASAFAYLPLANQNEVRLLYLENVLGRDITSRDLRRMNDVERRLASSALGMSEEEFETWRRGQVALMEGGKAATMFPNQTKNIMFTSDPTFPYDDPDLQAFDAAQTSMMDALNIKMESYVDTFWQHVHNFVGNTLKINWGQLIINVMGTMSGKIGGATGAGLLTWQKKLELQGTGDLEAYQASILEQVAQNIGNQRISQGGEGHQDKTVLDKSASKSLLDFFGGGISRGFAPGGMRHPIMGVIRAHHGVDIALATGVPVPSISIDQGLVVEAGWKGGYGKTVVVKDMSSGDIYLYGHLSRINVKSGDIIPRGFVVGNVGSTGMSTGPHLHFEVRRGGAPIDPGAAVQRILREHSRAVKPEKHSALTPNLVQSALNAKPTQVAVRETMEIDDVSINSLNEVASRIRQVQSGSTT